MIHLSRKDRFLTCEIISTVICPYCKAVGSQYAKINSRELAVFWIPLLPYKKITCLECLNCRKEYKESDLDEFSMGKITLLKSTAVYSWKSFIGLIIIAILLILDYFLW